MNREERWSRQGHCCGRGWDCGGTFARPLQQHLLGEPALLLDLPKDGRTIVEIFEEKEARSILNNLRAHRARTKWFMQGSWI